MSALAEARVLGRRRLAQLSVALLTSSAESKESVAFCCMEILGAVCLDDGWRCYGLPRKAKHKQDDSERYCEEGP